MGTIISGGASFIPRGLTAEEEREYLLEQRARFFESFDRESRIVRERFHPSWHLDHTGGGCTALGFDVQLRGFGVGGFLMATADDDATVPDPGDTVLIGYYPTDEDGEYDPEDGRFLTVTYEQFRAFPAWCWARWTRKHGAAL